MIALNKKSKKVFVVFEDSTFEEFSSYREALQELINTGDSIGSVSERSIYNALKLIELLTPSVAQQLRGMDNEEDYSLASDRVI